MCDYVLFLGSAEAGRLELMSTRSRRKISGKSTHMRGTMEECIGAGCIAQNSDQDRNWASAIGFE